MSYESYLIRLSRYTLGLFSLAIGVTLSIKSQLGVSPVNSLPYVVSQVMNLELGLVTTLVFTVYVLMQILLLRKDFKIYNLAQILVASVFGYFVTITNHLLQWISTPQFFPGRILLLVLSILIVAFGLFQYLKAELMAQPAEGLVLGISKISRYPVATVKLYFDCTIVLLSTLISYLSFGKIVGVGIGTVISAFMIGKTLHLMYELSAQYETRKLKTIELRRNSNG